MAFEVEKGEIQSEVFYQNANSLLSADDRTQSNIIKDFHSRMTLFVDPLVREATSGNDFDLRQLRREKMNVYIHIPEGDQKRLQPILTGTCRGRRGSYICSGAYISTPAASLTSSIPLGSIPGLGVPVIGAGRDIKASYTTSKAPRPWVGY